MIQTETALCRVRTWRHARHYTCEAVVLCAGNAARYLIFVRAPHHISPQHRLVLGSWTLLFHIHFFFVGNIPWLCSRTVIFQYWLLLVIADVISIHVYLVAGALILERHEAWYDHNVSTGMSIADVRIFKE